MCSVTSVRVRMALAMAVALLGNAASAAPSGEGARPVPSDGFRLAARKSPRAPQGLPAGESAAPQPSTPYNLTPLPPLLARPGTSPTPPLPPRGVIDEQPRHTLANCMKQWEPATHMTKAEWRATCQRTLKEAAAAARRQQSTNWRKK